MNASRIERYAKSFMDEALPLAKYRQGKTLPTDSRERIENNLRMFHEKGLAPKPREVI
jgi:hypothetical protein